MTILPQNDLTCNFPILANSNIEQKCAFQRDLKILSDWPKFVHGCYHWYKEQGQPWGAEHFRHFGMPMYWWTALESMHLDEANTLAPFSVLYLHSIKSYWQKTVCDPEWPQVTLWGSLGNKYTWVIKNSFTWHDLEKSRVIWCVFSK